MTQRPILFSGPMVRAIIEGRKTQTRRIIKPQPFPVGGPFYQPHPVTNPREWHSISRDGHIANIQTVRHAPGDLLWVRESWAHDGPDLETVRARHEDAIPGIGYGPYYQSTETAVDTLRWRPSIHMPRWASRITIEVEAATT